MNALQIFSSEFLPPFIGVVFGLSIGFLAKWCLAPDGNLPFINPKSFAELAVLPEDEQKRLLHEASQEAPGLWSWFVPGVLLATMFAMGAALGRTLPKISTLPDTMAVHAAFAGLFAGLGGWMAIRLQVRCVRPFLKRCMERTRPAG